MENSIKTVDNVLEMIEEKLYLTQEEKYGKETKEIEETYQSIILIVVEDLTSEKLTEKNFPQFKRKDIESSKKNIQEYEEQIMKKLNCEDEIKGYSFLPTGLGHYESKEELINQIIRQTTLTEKKYIYISLELDKDINKLEEQMTALTQEIKETMLIVVGNKKEKKVPFLFWTQKEETKDWLIRYPKENEYNRFIRMARGFEKLYKTSRKDIFDGNVPYGRVEFYNLCNPHQLKTLLVYEQNNNILGFIEGEIISTLGKKNLTNRLYMRINKLYVTESRRREKIATRLYEEIWKKAIKDKCDHLEVKVYNFTPEAKIFFESLGLNILSYQYEMKVPRK